MLRDGRDDTAIAAETPRGEGSRVLVAYATRFGSTTVVAERIAATLRAHAVPARCVPVDAVGDLEAYDAVVLGSPVFNQRWLPEADAFVGRTGPALTAREVWLFSVGTFGDGKPVIGAMMRREPKNIAALREAVGARGYRVFAGVIARELWPGPSRVLLHLFGGRLGDHRDWREIQDWSREIAAALRARA